MLVSSFNLSQSFNYTPYLFYKKQLKTEIDSLCIWTRDATWQKEGYRIDSQIAFYTPGHLGCVYPFATYCTVRMSVFV
jgi:hypothetical protein